MNHTLETFAYGNMAPNAQPFPENPEYRDAMRALSRTQEKLMEKLNDEEKVIFEKHIDAQDEVRQLTAVYNWIHGYKLGLLVTAEVFVTA